MQVTDWPGYFPNGPEIVRLLAEAGAGPNARQPGEETPLHWAASSDDWHVAAALIDAGADINAPDGSIGTHSRTPSATTASTWPACSVDRGADVDRPWMAASLGLLDRLAQLLGDNPSSEEVSQAFWHACSGGQRQRCRVPDGPRGGPQLGPRLRRRHTA